MRRPHLDGRRWLAIAATFLLVAVLAGAVVHVHKDASYRISDECAACTIGHTPAAPPVVPALIPPILQTSTATLPVVAHHPLDGVLAIAPKTSPPRAPAC